MLAVGFDQSEGINRLEAYRQDQGYPWPVATGPRQMARDYEVLIQATKLGISPEGIVVFRKGYGTNSPEEWRGLLDTLSATAGFPLHP